MKKKKKKGMERPKVPIEEDSMRSKIIHRILLPVGPMDDVTVES